MTMTRQQAAAGVRTGLKLAEQFPERWDPRVFLGWLPAIQSEPAPTHHGLIDFRQPSPDHWSEPPGSTRGACGCALGLGALAIADGKRRMAGVKRVMDKMRDALGSDVFNAISSASCCATSLEDMIERVEAVLVENGL